MVLMIKKVLILWKPRKGEELLNYEDLETILETHGNEIALIMIGGVNYYTGQFFDLKRITELVINMVVWLVLIVRMAQEM